MKRSISVCPYCFGPMLQNEICCLTCPYDKYPAGLPVIVYLIGFFATISCVVQVTITGEIPYFPLFILICSLTIVPLYALNISQRKRQIQAVRNRQRYLHKRGIMPFEFQVWQHEAKAFCLAATIPESLLPHNLHPTELGQWLSDLILARNKISAIYPNIRRTVETDLAPLKETYEQHERRRRTIPRI